MKIDNFALTMFQTCPIKYFLRMHEDWTSRRRSGALGFGGALHEGLATYYRTGDKQTSILAIDEAWPDNLPIDDWRTKSKCVTVMIDYMKQYPVETFRVIGAEHDAPMIENNFTIATGLYLDCQHCGWHLEESQIIWDDSHEAVTIGLCPVCKQPLEEIEYGGIFDGGVEWSGAVYVFEHKTTSQMGDYYFNQFKPNNQITGYVWALRQLTGRRVGGAIINAIGIYKASATKFRRHITTRTDKDIAVWLENVRSTCQMIKDCERRGYWPMHTGSCTMYGKCEYHDVHQLSEPAEQQKFLEQMFVKEPWNYERRDEVKEASDV